MKPEESLYIKRNPLFRDRGLFLEKHREDVSSKMEKAMFSVNRFLLSPLLFIFEKKPALQLPFLFKCWCLEGYPIACNRCWLQNIFLRTAECMGFFSRKDTHSVKESPVRTVSWRRGTSRRFSMSEILKYFLVYKR